MKQGVEVEQQDSFDYFMITALLVQKGFRFDYETGYRMEVWRNYETDRSYKIEKTSNVLPREDLLNILEQAGISLDEFMELI